ncbi:uncharacterized protein LOC108033065 [Drosophila biarmipes]|uniref:uncharacterized protein LOC108033065 n=1 Tax=Drosophila biarmipes TaxID=125945 RepID=UPI0007E770D5|nr:uncharacterized protein LOC108033065 [Drosophila biarmipes]
MSDESSQSGSGSENGQGPEEDVEQARTRSSSEELRSNEWLSLHDFPPGSDDHLLSIFSRFCSMTAYRKRKKGLELRFASAEHLQRGVLMAKRLVVGQLQIRWHLGRLEDDPAGQPNPRKGRNPAPGGLSVFSKLRRAFSNYFQ